MASSIPQLVTFNHLHVVDLVQIKLAIIDDDFVLSDFVETPSLRFLNIIISLIVLAVLVWMNKLALSFSEIEFHEVNQCDNKRDSFQKNGLNFQKKFFDRKFVIYKN